MENRDFGYSKGSQVLTRHGKNFVTLDQIVQNGFIDTTGKYFGFDEILNRVEAQQYFDENIKWIDFSNKQKRKG